MKLCLKLATLLCLVAGIAGCSKDTKVIMPTNKADIKGESKTE